MTGKKRIFYAFHHKEGDRVSVYEQAFASSVASKILGRRLFTGSTSLFYEESKAWLKGEEAHKEFEEKVWEDLITITKYFEFDAVSIPWRLKDKPTKQLDEYNFLYGDQSELQEKLIITALGVLRAQEVIDITQKLCKENS